MTDNRPTKQTLPFGTWPSGLTAATVANQGRRLAEPMLTANAVYWLESRPQEKGRVQIVRQLPDGNNEDLLPDGFSARSKVHEYGGGSYLATDEVVYFVNGDDQQVYALDLGAQGAGTPRALTDSADCRFTDLHLDPARERLLAVCEEHTDDKVLNYLVAIPSDGSKTLTLLCEGADFYSNPRVNPEGTHCIWLSWDHPDMPWDSTQLWLARLDAEGAPVNAHCIAGGQGDESIFQPQWSPAGGIYFVSDRTGWWNIYHIPRDHLEQGQSQARPVTLLEAEFATPQWTFNMSTFGFLSDHEIVATFTRSGQWYLCHIDTRRDELQTVATEQTQFSAVHCRSGEAVMLAAAPAYSPGVYRYRSGELAALAASASPLAQDDVSVPQAVSFPTSEGAQAHGFFYPPQNANVCGPADEKPPLIVIGHGGPTGATDTSLNLKIQYWTNRGFAVLDVNYRGSTGYGRDYRQTLYGQWGLRDVEDVCAAADFATQQGWAHPRQRIIKGSSAGGYTVLAALTFKTTFDAGVSLYGIGDLELLALDTHKFEARYLDKLVGPYPADKARYRALSPIHHVEQLDCPLLAFQGLEDHVVPPNQAETMVRAVAERGVPVAYVTYANEGHGFRQAETVDHMLTAEHYFYQRIFSLGGEPPAEAPVAIQNLERRPAP